MSGSLFLFSKDVARLLNCGENKARLLLKKGLIQSCLWNNNEHRTTLFYVEKFVQDMIENRIDTSSDPVVYQLVHGRDQHLYIEDEMDKYAHEVVKQALG